MKFDMNTNRSLVARKCLISFVLSIQEINSTTYKGLQKYQLYLLHMFSTLPIFENTMRVIICMCKKLEIHTLASR